VVGPELGAGIAQPGVVAEGADVGGDEDAGAPGVGEAVVGAEAGGDVAAVEDEEVAEVDASAAAVPVGAGCVRSLKQ
jgi:hypothetical protein